nr:hypothetical protein [Mycolicibacterium mucogenicum]
MNYADRASTHHVSEPGAGSFDLQRPRLGPELPRHIPDLSQAGRTTGVSATD